MNKNNTIMTQTLDYHMINHFKHLFVKHHNNSQRLNESDGKYSVVSYNDIPGKLAPSVTVWYQTDSKDDANDAADVYNKQNPNCERIVAPTWQLLL
jgi:hypothetical protein